MCLQGSFIKADPAAAACIEKCKTSYICLLKVVVQKPLFMSLHVPCLQSCKLVDKKTTKCVQYGLQWLEKVG